MDRQLATISIAALATAFCLSGLAHADDEEAGKAAYELNCSSCHGLAGKGDGPVSFALNPKPRDFSTGEFKLDANKSGAPGEDEDMKLVIKNGALPYGGSPLMAGWPSLGDDQIGPIITHIRSFAEANAGGVP